MLEFALSQSLNIAIISMLARLLTPQDFGTFALLGILLGTATALIEGGFGLALVQKQDTTEEDNSTVFWIGISASTFFGLALAAAAPVIAAFFNLAVLEPLTHIMALTVWISGLGIVQRSMLVKRLAFRNLAIINLSALIVSSMVAVVLARLGCGVYTLAWQGFVYCLVTCALMWGSVPWRPTLVFRLSSAKRLFRFGGFMLASSLLEVIYSKSYTLFIGKLYGPAELGQFSRAEAATQLVSGLVTNSLSKVAFPAFAEMRDSPLRIRAGLKAALRVSMLFHATAVLTLAVVARPFVLTILGPQWELAAQILPVLTLSMILMPLHVLNLQVLMALGRGDLFFVLEVLKKIVGIGIIAISSSYGVFGIAWGLVITGLISFIINAWYTGILLNFGPIRQAIHVLPSLGYGLIAAAASYAAMTYSGVQIEMLLLIVGIGTSAATFIGMVGSAWFFGYDLTDIFSLAKT